METRYSVGQEQFQRMTTSEMRGTFLLENLFETGKIQLVYWEIDRAVIGSAIPTDGPLRLEAGKELAADYFAQRREIGVFNIGGKGAASVDGKKFEMDNRDALYIGRGAKEILFTSADKDSPAAFYLLSYPAHADFPTTPARIADAEAVKLGTSAECNERTIYKAIHPGGIRSCQLVMGFTELAPGSIWNTMPAHTHERRSEVYLYFEVPEKARVFHLLGRPEETRHLVVQNRQVALSPSWSIHSGAGTANYCFIWGMGGENQDFGDMDAVGLNDIR